MILPVGPNGGIILTKEAIRYIFENHYPRLVTYTCQIIQEEDRACDIVMAMMGKVWEKKQGAEFRDEQILVSFLYRCIRNKLLNDIRDARKYDRTLSEYRKIIAGFEQKGQVSRFGSKVVHEIDSAVEELLPLVERLSDRYKKIILLGLAGYTDQQVADKLGTTVANVRVNRSRAVVNLRREVASGVTSVLAWFLLMALWELKYISGPLQHIIYSYF